MTDLNQVVIDGEKGLLAKLCALPDHRKPRGVCHELAAILLVCVAAMLAGAHDPTEIAEWAADLSDEARLRLRLHLRRSPSSGPAAMFGVAVDGKTLRGAVQPDGRAVHLLSAMTHDERVVIAQAEVADSTGRRNTSTTEVASGDQAGRAKSDLGDARQVVLARTPARLAT
jgi:hypothetical protein